MHDDPVYKNTRRLLPGALLKYQRGKKKVPVFFILQRHAGSYYLDTQGVKYNKNYCTIISKNSGLVFI